METEGNDTVCRVPRRVQRGAVGPAIGLAVPPRAFEARVEDCLGTFKREASSLLPLWVVRPCESQLLVRYTADFVGCQRQRVRTVGVEEREHRHPIWP